MDLTAVNHKDPKAQRISGFGHLFKSHEFTNDFSFMKELYFTDIFT